MRIGILTREWPPEIYGGAGVHVEYLCKALDPLVDVSVHAFGGAGAAVTTHSLEPHRPWKADQLGGGYRISSWAEKTALADAAAVIAVSHGMRADVLDVYPFLDPARVQVVHNGIDTAEYAPAPDVDVLERLGVDPSLPYAMFVGRITHQKGVEHLLRSAASWPGQLVFCGGAPDTPEIAASVAGLVADLQASRPGVIWVKEMLPRPDVVQLLSHATVFVCPSVYEPLGIVNLEAMACGTAVVASRVGGIPEVVEEGVTGLLVDLDEGFESSLAAAVTSLLEDPARAASMGAAGRARAIAEFSWDAIAARTVEVYRSVLATS
jgi:starch synthase